MACILGIALAAAEGKYKGRQPTAREKSSDVLIAQQTEASCGSRLPARPKLGLPVSTAKLGLLEATAAMSIAELRAWVTEPSGDAMWLLGRLAPTTLSTLAVVCGTRAGCLTRCVTKW